MQSGSQLHHLFVTILLFCLPSSPSALWNEFRQHICDDLEYKLRHHHGIENPSEDQIYDYGLYLINTILQSSGKSLSQDFPDMLQIVHHWDEVEGNRYIIEQRAYNPETEAQQAQHNIALLNASQRRVFDTVFDTAMGRSEQKLFFVNGPGGTGKSFIWSTLAHALRAEGKIVLCVASSGIASLLLPGGRTAHSTFAIPIPTLDTSMCLIRRGSDKAQLMQEISLIIWDEAPMQHRHVMETVDRTLRDLRQEPDICFGGIPVAWGGDFQQTLPVVPKGRKEDIVAACLQKSYLWQQVKVLHLTENMRVERNNPESIIFAQWLLDVGSGKDLPIDHKMAIPPHMLTPQTVDELINEIYPNIEHGDTLTPDYFLKRAILAARNDEVSTINANVLERFPGREWTLHGVDKIVEDRQNPDIDYAIHYPLEFLNSIEMGGLPPAVMRVKKGVPLMLLRNLNPNEGLCNGTRLLLLKASNRVLHVCILTGPKANTTAFIPRIILQTNEEDFPFTLSRRQFPVRLAFGMTINKAQGQSLDTVGLNIFSPVFSHGQLYVGMSRGTNWRKVKVLLTEGSNGMTQNIVYPDVLLHP
ncbi:MAG TPA: AAA family ATPase [Chlamydiales bacterium]|nr:AAA family ATPase [Chlamydiales bacterium]